MYTDSMKKLYLNILNTTGSPCHELTSREDLTPISSDSLDESTHSED
jgi:hypothetical protein